MCNLNQPLTFTRYRYKSASRKSEKDDLDSRALAELNGASELDADA